MHGSQQRRVAADKQRKQQHRQRWYSFAALECFSQLHIKYRKWSEKQQQYAQTPWNNSLTKYKSLQDSELGGHQKKKEKKKKDQKPTERQGGANTLSVRSRFYTCKTKKEELY